MPAPAPATFPVVVDTAAGQSRPLAARALGFTFHPVLYIGPPHDTLRIRHGLTSARLPPPLGRTEPPAAPLAAYARYDEDGPAPTRWQFGQRAQTRLLVDTTITIKAAADYPNKAGWFDAYPVLISNQDADTVIIGHGDALPLEVEARDAHGQWRLIEKPYSYFCGTGLPMLFLPPRQVALTSVYIPHGPQRTVLRVRFGRHTSAEFAGRIDPKQFYYKPTE